MICDSGTGLIWVTMIIPCLLMSSLVACGAMSFVQDEAVFTLHRVGFPPPYLRHLIVEKGSFSPSIEHIKCLTGSSFECVYNIKLIPSITLYAIYGVVRFQIAVSPVVILRICLIYLNIIIKPANHADESLTIA